MRGILLWGNKIPIRQCYLYFKAGYMNTNYRIRVVFGCMFLVYAILSKIFGWQGSGISAKMAVIFLIFGLISWIAGQTKKKEEATQN